MVKPFIDDPRVVGTGGVIRTVNGSHVEGGRVVSATMPRRWVERVQVLEYLRSFLLGRTGWSRLGALLIISGAFGVFRRDVVVKAGGMDLNTLAEDAELVLRIHRTMRERRREYRIAFVPEPVCWTEVPHTTAVLARQRRRWSQGLAEVLWTHRDMMGNPRYGRIGLFTLPYYLLFELLGPVFETAGLAVVIASFALGIVNLPFALVFAGVAFGYGMFVSDVAVAVEEFSFHRYRRTGTMPWRMATQQFAPFASVTPNRLRLAPDQTRTFSVSTVTPSQPGDASGSIVIDSERDGQTTVPVTLRSRVEVPSGGTFSGALRGGNGRSPGEGQVQYYEFNVPAGVRDITADVVFANDPANPVGSYLISPDGATAGYGQNSAGGSSFNALSAYTLNPVPGTWTLIVDFAEPVVGNEVSQPYAGQIRFNVVDVHASGVPNGGAQTSLPAGKPATATVTIHNTSRAPEGFFVDPRLNRATTFDLVSPDPANTLPLTSQVPVWLVPTQLSSITAAQASSVPTMFDFAPSGLFFVPSIGDPDIASAGFGPGPLCATSESASYSPAGGKVTAGVWAAAPTGCGPYPPGGAHPGTVTDGITAQGKPFDTSVTSDTSDLWLQSVDPSATVSPVVIQPGQTGTINVTFTPSGAKGSVVNGTLYVDDITDGVPAYYQFSGDELAAVPYSYTIK